MSMERRRVQRAEMRSWDDRSIVPFLFRPDAKHWTGVQSLHWHEIKN
jgi:hypothetical protein